MNTLVSISSRVLYTSASLRSPAGVLRESAASCPYSGNFHCGAAGFFCVVPLLLLGHKGIRGQCISLLGTSLNCMHGFPHCSTFPHVLYSQQAVTILLHGHKEGYPLVQYESCWQTVAAVSQGKLSDLYFPRYSVQASLFSHFDQGLTFPTCAVHPATVHPSTGIFILPGTLVK